MSCPPPPDNLTEAALGIVIANSDPLFSLAPSRLMSANRYLAAVGRLWKVSDQERYKTWNLSSRFLPQGGRHVSSGEMDDAIYTCLASVIKAEGIGYHGTSYSVLQPVLFQLDNLRTDQDGRTLPIYLQADWHECREYIRRKWVFNKVHGKAYHLHTCNGVPREIMMRTYDHGVAHGLQFRICIPEGQTHSVRVQISMFNQDASTYTEEGVLPAAHCTRSWRRLCGDYTDEIRALYEEFMIDEFGPLRMFEDRHRFQMPVHLVEVFERIWM